jgi:putative hydrolase of the HAD superfamily
MASPERPRAQRPAAEDGAAAGLIGLPPERCVYVDDLPLNLPPAAKLGMATIHHVDAAHTIPALERLLGIALR